MIFERDIIVFLQSLSSSFLDGLMKVVAYIFDWPLVVALGIILLIFKKNKQALFFLILEGAGLLFQVVLKAIISRPRPYLTYPEIINILQASNSSFPSGHSITCMMAIIMLWVMVYESKMKKTARGLSYCGLVLASLLCAFNRMYLGQHYLTDVLGGFTIALILGLLIIKFAYFKSFNKNRINAQ